MASKELVRAWKSYENYIERHGVSDEVLEPMVAATRIAFQEGDNEYGMKLKDFTLENIERIIRENGGKAASSVSRSYRRFSASSIPFAVRCPGRSSAFSRAAVSMPSTPSLPSLPGAAFRRSFPKHHP